MVKKKTGKYRLSNRKFFALAALFLLAIGLSVLFCWLFLCLAARILCSVDVAEQLHIPLATGCCAAAVFLVTCILLQKIGQHGIVWGTAIAAGVWIICFLIGVLQGESLSQLSLFRALLYLCCGMLGGMCGILLYERRKKRRK